MKSDDARKQQGDDLRAVMGTPAGRRFLWRVMTQSGVFGPSHTGDALATAYNEGRRSVGIELMLEAQGQMSELYVLGLREELDRIEAAKEAAEEKRKANE